MPELKKLAAMILVQMPFVRNEADFAAMVKHSVKRVERELRRRKQHAKREAEERELWEIDKSLSPAPIREALTELGY